MGAKLPDLAGDKLRNSDPKQGFDIPWRRRSFRRDASGALASRFNHMLAHGALADYLLE